LTRPVVPEQYEYCELHRSSFFNTLPSSLNTIRMSMSMGCVRHAVFIDYIRREETTWET